MNKNIKLQLDTVEKVFVNLLKITAFISVEFAAVFPIIKIFV